MHYDNFPGHPALRSGRIAIQSRQNNLLSRAGDLPRILDQLRGIVSAQELPDWHRLQVHIKAQLVEFVRNVVNGCISLRRTLRSRTDAVRQVFEFVVRVVILHCGFSDARQFAPELG